MALAIGYLLLVMGTGIALASDQITATLTFTNSTTNGLTITITTGTASVRTWTNSVVTASIQILTNATAAGSASNLEAQLELYPVPGSFSRQSTPTNIVITANCGTPLTVASSGNYLSVSYATQACTAMWTVRIPASGEQTGQRTNVASALSDWLENSANTNSIDQNSTAMSEVVGTTNAQTISGVKRFTGANYHTNAILDHVTLTNGVNRGSAFSSVGTGTSSEQFGLGASAIGDNSLAFGYNATTPASLFGQGVALGQNTSADQYGVAVGSGAIASIVVFGGGVAVGRNANAETDHAIALGDASDAGGGSGSIALGASSIASSNQTIAIGYHSSATFSNSIAIGPYSATTADNQMMLGASGQSVFVNNNLTAQSNLTVGLALQVSGSINGVHGSTTNGTLYNPTVQGATLQQFTAKGTNNFPANSDIAFTRLANSSLANGNNAGVVIGTNVVMEVSGPSGAFTINGLTASPNRDGKIVWIINQTGQTMTIANESGVDATAGNRVRTGYGADITVTNNPGCVQLFYSGAASRWLITSKTP